MNTLKQNNLWVANRKPALRPDSQVAANIILETHHFIYTNADGWFAFLDKRWKPMTPDDVLRLIRDEICLLDEERAWDFDDTRDKEEDDVELTLSVFKEIRNLLRLDCVKDKIPHMNPDLIPLPNTQLLWVAGESDFREVAPCPENYVMNMLTVEYQPEAQCPKFQKALERIVPRSEDRQIIQMYFGAALFPQNFSRKILILIGEGSSGKSLLVLLLSKILGRARVFDLKFENLSEKFALADLTRETSLLSGSEAIARTLCGRGGEWAKRLVGGDEFAVQLKYKNKSLEYAGHYSVVIVSNNKLRFEFETQGQEWRDRILPIFFRKSIPEAEQDRDLLTKLYAEEGPGILNWMLDGARKVRRNNWRIELDEPQRIERDNLIAFSGSVKSFVAEFIQSAGDHFLTSDAYALYNRLVQSRNLPFLTIQKFGRDLAKEMGERFGATPTQNLRGNDGKAARGYYGFTLNQQNNDSEHL